MWIMVEPIAEIPFGIHRSLTRCYRCNKGDILVLYNHKIHLEVRVLYNMLPNLLTFS
jgi:hypothetical protein